MASYHRLTLREREEFSRLLAAGSILRAAGSSQRGSNLILCILRHAMHLCAGPCNLTERGGHRNLDDVCAWIFSCMAMPLRSQGNACYLVCGRELLLKAPSHGHKKY